MGLDFSSTLAPTNHRLRPATHPRLQTLKAPRSPGVFQFRNSHSISRTASRAASILDETAGRDGHSLVDKKA